MFYRIRIDLSFDDEDAIDDIKDKVLDRFPEALTINPGMPEVERGYIITVKCFHDQDPNEPCKLIEEHQTPE